MNTRPARSQARPTRGQSLCWALLSENRWDLSSVALLLVYSCVCLGVFRDYGLTYDEPNHVLYGDLIVEYFRTWGESKDALEFSRYYGGGFDLFAALLRRALPLDTYEATHLACVIAGLLSVAGCWGVARQLSGPAAGLVAMLTLGLTPVYFAHQFNNMKDIPFAAGYIWALYFCVKCLSELPRPRLQVWLGFGLCAGLAMSVRIAGLLLLLYGLAALLVTWGAARVRASVQSNEPFSDLRCLLRALGAWSLSAGIAWVVMVAPWPWALQAPLSRPFETLSRFSNYQAYTSPTLLHGEMVPSNGAPWDYLPSYFALQLPELALPLMLAAVGLLIWGCVRFTRHDHVELRKVAALGVVVVSVLFPPAYAAAKGATVYDGLRQFLFLVPPLCALVGVGAQLALRFARVRARFLSWGLAAVFGLCITRQAVAMVQLHPYQHVHFNWFAGGYPEIAERYETEYYGTTYLELHRQLAQFAFERDADYLSRIYRVTGCGTHVFFRWHLPENFRYISRRKAKEADFYATYRRFDCHRAHPRPAKLVEIQRKGMLLAQAQDMRTARRQRRRSKRAPAP